MTAAAQIKELKEVVNGWREQPEVVANFLRWNNRFHKYSPFNRMMILAQRPDATRCAGFGNWKELGRSPKGKGTGIAVFYPRIKTEDVHTESGTEERTRVMGFGISYTFDISNTKPIDPENDTYDQLVSELDLPARSLEEFDAFIEHIANSAMIQLAINDYRNEIAFSAAPAKGERMATLSINGERGLRQSMFTLTGLIEMILNPEAVGAYAMSPEAFTNTKLVMTPSRIGFRTSAAAWAIADRFGLDVTPHLHLMLGTGMIPDDSTFDSELLAVTNTLKAFEMIENGTPFEWASAYLESVRGIQEDGQ